ncbi:MAG: hypothetical protein JWO81_2171 [Alphaproteobacteria bacterium]|nr:hypothetical protein [Alphaproteobacteria bacterium]
MIEPMRDEERAWPLRALLLLALGALCGIAVHFLTKGPHPWQWTDQPVKLGAAAFVSCGGIIFAFSLERRRWTWSAGFALLAGLVLGLVTYSNGSFSLWGSNEGWQFFSALLALAIAVPLFQTARDSERPWLDYQRLHAHSWTNIVLWGAAWAFVLAVFLLAQLLAGLFDLIGIHLLSDLVRKEWFLWLLVGGSLGAAVGMLRDRDAVLGLLQRVATAILSVLTPILAAGLVLFVLSLPFTGLEPLWSQTKATTPILLACVLGAFLLVNATVGSAPDEEPRSPILRHAALALAAVMLPLAVVAAVSTGKRVGQYGLTPDRLWAMVFVLMALACGLGYWAAIIRRRLRWSEDMRRVNIGLALGICALSLLLALPVLSFGAISARNQVAQLQSGRVAPDKFDWAALRFDFGPAGAREVRRLAREAGDARVRLYAARILAAKERYAARNAQEAARRAELPRVVTVLPHPVPVPKEIVDLLFAEETPGTPAGLCVDTGRCLLKWQPGERAAAALLDTCGPDPSEPGKPGAARFGGCRLSVRLLEQTDKGWREAGELATEQLAGQSSDPALRAARAAALKGEVEVREAKVRQIYVGGKPAGGAYR